MIKRIKVNTNDKNYYIDIQYGLVNIFFRSLLKEKRKKYLIIDTTVFNNLNKI